MPFRKVLRVFRECSFHAPAERTASSAQLWDLLHTCTSPNLSVTALVLTTICSLWDCMVIVSIYKTAFILDSYIDMAEPSMPHPFLTSFARFALWSLYGFWAGLFATGLWVIGHECGHQAFSERKVINNTVGWLLHSAWATHSFLQSRFSQWRRPFLNTMQPWCTIPFLADHTRQTSCIHRPYDPRSGLRSAHPFRAWPQALWSRKWRHIWRERVGWGHAWALGGFGRFTSWRHLGTC